MDVHERRRVVVATVVTLVALPALWLLDRDDPAAAPNVAAAGVPAPVATDGGQPAVTTAPEIPVFLEGDLVAPPPIAGEAATADTPGDNEVTGRAAFKRFTGAVVPSCAMPTAPNGAEVTVTNVDNGLSLTCTNTLAVPTLDGVLVTIDTDLYLTIADLVDSPIPVRVDW